MLPKNLFLCTLFKCGWEYSSYQSIDIEKKSCLPALSISQQPTEHIDNVRAKIYQISLLRWCVNSDMDKNGF